MIRCLRKQELLFPPKTAIECKHYSWHGNKRLVHVSFSVSTMRPETDHIEHPDTVPNGLLSV